MKVSLIVKVVVADMNDLRKLVSEYGKIGSNLNQIAKHFNSGEIRVSKIRSQNRRRKWLDFAEKIF